MDVDKAPFFVTLAVAIAGWSATYVVGRITNSPTLEYEVAEPVTRTNEQGATTGSQTIKLSNLTRSSTFKSLTVIFVAQGNTRILGETTEVYPIPPAFEGNEPWKLQGGLARYVIPKIQPGGQFVVRVGYIGDAPPVLRLESDDTIYLTRPNWETCIVRNESWIFLVIGGVWALIVGVFLFQNWREHAHSKRPPAPIQDERETNDATG